MAFVNEYISQEDFDKYEIGKIDQRYIAGGTNARDWAVDRERNMYLRQVATGREEFRHQSTWTFYWHGELLTVELDTIDAKGERGGAFWVHRKIRGLSLPAHLECKRAEIIEDIREALTAYKTAGVYSTATEFSLTLSA